MAPVLHVASTHSSFHCRFMYTALCQIHITCDHVSIPCTFLVPGPLWQFPFSYFSNHSFIQRIAVHTATAHQPIHSLLLLLVYTTANQYLFQHQPIPPPLTESRYADAVKGPSSAPMSGIITPPIYKLYLCCLSVPYFLQIESLLLISFLPAIFFV